MPPIEEVIAEARRGLATSVDSPLLLRITQDYATAAKRLEALALRLSLQAADIVAAGGDPFTVAIRLGRAELLASQVRAEVERVTARANGLTRAAQRVAIIRGLETASELVRSLAPGVRLNAVASERIVAGFAEGSPLRDLMLNLPEQAQQRYREAFVQGVIDGSNPRKIAAKAADSLDQAKWRTLTQSRTEVMRAYRGASQESYRANRDLLGGWVWVSARDTRTCAACWAMHGTVHPLDETFASHPNCRCSAGPLPAGERSPIVSGEEQFAKLSGSRQLQVLGPAKFRAYQDGAIRLEDLVRETNHPRWGAGRVEASLRSVLGPDAMRYYAA